MLSESRPEVKRGEYWANMVSIEGHAPVTKAMSRVYGVSRRRRLSVENGETGTRGTAGRGGEYYMASSTRRGRLVLCG